MTGMTRRTLKEALGGRAAPEVSVFLLLVASVVLVNLPYFSASIWDRRDTTAIYQSFHFFYNEYFFSHSVPGWIPYLYYGHPAAFYQIFHLSSVDYLTISAGAFLGIRDSYLVFNASSLVEQLIFLCGTHLLSRQLFSTLSARLVTTLSAVASMVWYWHVFYALQPVYLLPSILHFLVLFSVNRRPHWLWLAGTAFMLLAPGCGYNIMLVLFSLAIFACILFSRNPPGFRCFLEPSRANVLILALFLGVSGCVFLCYSHSLDSIAVMMRMRSESGQNDLGTFLHYGGNATPLKIVTALFSGNVRSGVEGDWDNNLYVGILPLFLLAFAALRERRAMFWAFAAPALVLACLSFGGVVGLASSFFPFIRYYRWVAWIFGLVKLFIAFGAGYGMERLLLDGDGKRGRLRTALIAAALLVIAFECLLAGSALDILNICRTPWMQLLLARLGIYLALATASGATLWFSLRRGPGALRLIATCAAALALFACLAAVSINVVLPAVASIRSNHSNNPLLYSAYYTNPEWRDPPKFVRISSNPKISGDMKDLQSLISAPDCPKAFSCEWEGFIRIRESGEHTFATHSTDGSWIWIDGVLVVDNGGKHDKRLAHGKIVLDKGFHRVRIRYSHQSAEEVVIDPFWGMDTRILNPIPAAAFSITRPWGEELMRRHSTLIAAAACSGVALAWLALFFASLLRTPGSGPKMLLGGALTLGLVFDLGLYQAVMAGKLPENGVPGFKTITSVHEAEYQEKREASPSKIRQKLALVMGGGALYYPYVYMFSQFEPTLYSPPESYMTTMAKDMPKLFRSRNLAPYDYRSFGNDAVLLEMVGRSSPKLLLVAAGNAIHAKNEDNAMAIAGLLEDIGGRVIIEAGDGPLEAAAGGKSAASHPGSAGVEEYSTGRVKINARVDDPEGAWLVYSDAYHPGWKAKVDGVPAKVLRANVAFKALKLTPGAHTVEFSFGTLLDRSLAFILWHFFALGIAAYAAYACAAIIRGPSEARRS